MPQQSAGIIRRSRTVDAINIVFIAACRLELFPGQAKLNQMLKEGGMEDLEEPLCLKVDVPSLWLLDSCSRSAARLSRP